MAGNNKAQKQAPQRVLVADIGGSHVKLRIDARGAVSRFESGARLTPAQLLQGIRTLLPAGGYDVVSLGYPGMVFRGRIAREPHNLGGGWVGFDFARALGKPVRIVNDAAMQAIGSYRGGRMLFLGLGTGLGATLIIDGVVEPTEIAHLPWRRGISFEGHVGERARQRHGNRKWRKAVLEVVGELRAALEPDYVVLGGGNAARMKRLPSWVRLGTNLNAFTGGVRLWRSGRYPVTLPGSVSAPPRGARR